MKIDRFWLKIIAVTTMFIDHIAAIVGLDYFSALQLDWLYIVMRSIGRISFPIFAFFVAEGWQHTKNKTKYFLYILIFAIISQPIYYFALNEQLFELNILFTFCISILLFVIVDNIKQYKSLTFIYICSIFAILMVVFMLDAMGITISYGVYGVLLPLIFYILYNSNFPYHKLILWIIVAIAMILHWLIFYLVNPTCDILSFYTLFALLSIPVLLLYNRQKGKYSLKWFFYIFYPTHLLIIWLFSLII